MTSNKTISISPQKLQELLTRARELKAAKEEAQKLNKTTISALISSAHNSPSGTASIATQGFGKHGEAITYNAEQQQFISLSTSLASCVLIGAAGTGKTTCVMGSINTLISSGAIPIMRDTAGHKHLAPNSPGIVAVSFTRRAVANLRKAMPAGLESNCITIHKLLEYQPIWYEVDDPETGETKSVMRFEPSRNFLNPLPSSIKTIYIDEASMVSTDLFKQLESACPHGVQFVFIGDIQQLPPIFGPAILGFKMIELPTVELVQVYRQALESPIISLATNIKLGIQKPLTDKEVVETAKGKLILHPWKKKIAPDAAMMTFVQFIIASLEAGAYNPDTDCILIPFNKSFGTIEVNKFIANKLAKKYSRKVFEIVAGFNKVYFSEGDKVLYDKEDATIIKIEKNSNYWGKRPHPASVTLDYHGYDPVSQPQETESEEDIDAMLSHMAAYSSDSEERVKAASHKITVRLDDSDEEITIDTAGAINSLLLSYALTVHKAQGSEWDKVFLVLHQSHATMIQRELLYTAVTRAAKELYVICEKESFVSGVKSQKIKGNTLAEKAEVFKGKLENNGGTY